MLWDIDLIFGIWVYNDELQIKFTFCYSSILFGPWTLKFGQIFSCHHFISLWFEILTWFWNSFRLNDFWPTYSCWVLKFGQIFSCHHFFFTIIWDINLIFGMLVYSDELPIKIEFCSNWMILGWFTHLGLLTLAKYLVITTLLSLPNVVCRLIVFAPFLLIIIIILLSFFATWTCPRQISGTTGQNFMKFGGVIDICF